MDFEVTGYTYPPIAVIRKGDSQRGTLTHNRRARLYGKFRVSV